MALAFAARAREKWIFVVFVAFVAAILEDLASSIQTISLHKQVAKSSPNGIFEPTDNRPGAAQQSKWYGHSWC